MKVLNLKEIEIFATLPKDLDSGWIHPANEQVQRLIHTAREYHRVMGLLEEAADELCDHDPEALETITKHPGHRYWCNGHYVRSIEEATLYSRVREALKESEGK